MFALFASNMPFPCFRSADSIHHVPHQDIERVLAELCNQLLRDRLPTTPADMPAILSQDELQAILHALQTRLSVFFADWAARLSQLEAQKRSLELELETACSQVAAARPLAPTVTEEIKVIISEARTLVLQGRPAAAEANGIDALVPFASGVDQMFERVKSAMKAQGIDILVIMTH